LVRQGAPTASIVGSVRETFNMLVVSKAQIDSIRNKEITELISSNDLDPNASSIERLIQLFKRDSKVSFLYVMHKPGTGFVTQYKEKGSVTTSDTAISNDSGSTTAHINPVAENEMSMWRKANDLGEEHKVVVSFAWAHNEEARLFSMFPEFSCVDLTFGTNRERRPLLIFSSMSGFKKAFTGKCERLCLALNHGTIHTNNSISSYGRDQMFYAKQIP